MKNDEIDKDEIQRLLEELKEAEARFWRLNRSRAERDYVDPLQRIF